MNIVFYYIWDNDKKFFESRNIGESIQLFYNDKEYTRTVYKKNIASIIELVNFIDGFGGYVMLFPDAIEYFDCTNLGLTTESKELIKNCAAIYVDGIGW